MAIANVLFRAIVAVSAVGMFLVAVILLGEAGTNIVSAAKAIITHDATKSASALVMKSVDECLFGFIVALLGIRLFVTYVASPQSLLAESTPDWLKPSNIRDLKSTFCQTIVVYLIVDFATDMTMLNGPPTLEHLVLPTAILIIAAALRFMPHGDAKPGH